MAGKGRRRSGGWWAVAFGLCLATASFIAFDVLDLDGSTFRDPDISSKTATEPSQDETERALHSPLLHSDSSTLAVSLLTSQSVGEALHSLQRRRLASP
jgi:hypothetical protein